MSINDSSIKRLREIKAEIGDLLEEATNIVRIAGDDFIYKRAQTYWLNDIDLALDNYRAGNNDMQETINDLAKKLVANKEENLCVNCYQQPDECYCDQSHL